jgi:hypothetical protein
LEGRLEIEFGERHCVNIIPFSGFVRVDN